MKEKGKGWEEKEEKKWANREMGQVTKKKMVLKLETKKESDH